MGDFLDFLNNDLVLDGSQVRENIERAIGIGQNDAVKKLEDQQRLAQQAKQVGFPPYYDFPAIDLPPGTQFKPMPTNHPQHVGQSAVAFAVLDPRGEAVFVVVELHRSTNRLGYVWILTTPNGKTVKVPFNTEGDELSQQIDNLICQMRRDANEGRSK